MSYDSQTSTTLINKLRKDVDSLTLKVAVLTDSKTSGTSGGSGVATTWTIRELNTIQSDPNGLILNLTGNTFKLAAGSYQVRNISAFLHTGHTRMRVYDVTNAVVIGYSVSVDVSNQANLYLDMNVRITPHKDTIYRIEYYITASGADHLGVAASLPTIDEIYSVCEITRLDTGMTKPLGAGGLQGPQGPAGPTGPAGPPGPTGGGVTSVNVSGGTTGLTTSGGPITSSGTITLGGVLAVASGGTGATTAAAALTSLGAYPASNPNGYNVGTVTNVTVTAANGITASVGTSTTTPAISLGLGAITPTSVASTGTVTGTNVSGTTSGTNTGDQAIVLSGDVSGSGSTGITTTIGANAVTYAKMQAASAVAKLIGSNASGTALGEITLGTNLSMAGSTLNAAVASGSVTSVNADGGTTGMSFSGGPITSSGTLTLGGTLDLDNGGTGAITASGARTNLGLAIGTDIPALNGTGATGTWNIDVLGSAGTITSTLPINKGGTGATTAGGALTNLGAYSDTNPAGYTSNTGTVTNVSASGGANISVATGSTTPVISQNVATSTQNGYMTSTYAAKLDSLTSGASVSSVGVSGGTTGLTTTGGPVTASGTITLGGILSVANGGTSSTSASSAISFLAGAVTNGQYLRGNGTVVQMSAIQAADLPAISLSTGVTGTLPIANGGTGLTAVGAQYQVLTSTGSAATWTTVDLNNSTSNVLPIAKGGTASITAQSAIDALAGSQTNGQYLRGNGTNVVMSAIQAIDLPQIALGGSAVSGTLGVINGGTGQSNVFTNGDLLIGNTTGGTLNRAKITGTGIITVTNGAGTINIGATGAGSGDVVGPSSANTNALAKFSSTTGKLIGEASWAENGGDLYGPAGATNMQYGFVWIPSDAGAPTAAPGQTGTLADRVPLYWDATNKRMYVYDPVAGWTFRTFDNN
jgi:hypothetical protein